MRRTKESFGRMLKRVRTHAGLSLRALEKVSNVDFSRIGRMELDRLVCGAERAIRLADALGLAGKSRELFLCSAAKTSGENPLAADYGQLPAEMFRWLGYVLTQHGVSPETVADVELEPATRVLGHRCDLLIRKRDGQVVGLEFRLYQHRAGQLRTR